MERIQLSIEKAVEDRRLEEKRLAEEEKLAEEAKLAEEEERRAEEERLTEEKRKVIEKEVGEDALFVRARNMLEDTQAYIRENEKMSLDVFRLEALMFKAKFAMDNKQYLEVIRYCTEAKDRAAAQRKELEEKDLSVDFEAEYKEMTARMELARSSGLQLTEEGKSMDAILRLKGEENYAEAMEKMKVVRDNLDRRLHEEVHLIGIAGIDEAVKELEKLRENTGETHDELEAYLNDAGEALKSEDYGKIDSLLKEFHTAISEYDTEASAGEYENLLEDLKSEIEQLEAAGIDVIPVRESIAQAKESLSRTEMGAAKEKLDEARTMIDNMKEKELKFAAKERFSEAKEMLALVKDAGIPIAKHKKILQESIKAFRQKDFMKAALIAIETKGNMMESLKEKDEKEGEDKEKEALERLAPIREEISEMMVKAKELGLVTESAEDRLDLVRSRLDESKFDDAEEMLAKVKKDLAELLVREKEEDLGSEMKELALRINTAKDNDLNIKKEEGFMKKIEKMSKEGKYEDARGMIKKVKGSVERKILKDLYEPRDKQMKEAVEFLVDYQKESDAKGVEELQDLLINARNALEEEEFQKTDSLFEEFKSRREVFTKKSRTEDYGNRIENLNSEIMKIKDLEIDVGDCEDLMVLARKSFERGEVDSRLKKMVSKSENILAGIREKQLPEKVRELISLAEQLIENVETLGADVGRFNSELNEASSAMDGSDHIGACQICISLRNELLELREELKLQKEREGQREDRERVKPVLDESMALLAEAKAIGLDVGLNADRVELARARFREGKFEGAEELAVVAKKEIEVLIENKLSVKFSKEMEYLTSPPEDEGVGTFDFAALDEADLIERTCPNCRKVGRGKRCVHCGNLMEEAKAEEEDEGPRCEMCSGRLEEEGEKLVCVDCGGEFDMDGKLIIPTEMPDIAEMLKPVEDEEYEEEMEEMMPVETGTGKVCELCGDELIRSGDLLICELCGVEYTTDGEVSVSGEEGPTCELCGGGLEKWGKGMRCPECEAEYNADGNLAIMSGEGVAIGKMISNLESMGDVKIPPATKKKVVRRAIRKRAPAAGPKPKKALKPVAGKKAPVKKMKPVKKAVPVKKGAPKKVIPKKKSPAKKVVPKKKDAKKGKKGPSWDELKEAKKKKAKKKGKDIDYERPNVLGMLKKK